jgi:NAD-dependent deacetylase
MKRIVVLTGAGVSAESGLSTFRDADGLWEGHDVMEVASPEGWARDRELVLKFYNERRAQLKDAKPNAAHHAIVDLEKEYDVTIITQNVDDLHERAGSTKVVHLHGELVNARSSIDTGLIYKIGYKEICIGDKCEKGSQLRPDVVWFGEMVPMIETAAEITMNSDIFIVVGTSLVVYPAASLIEYAPRDIPKYVIDPIKPDIFYLPEGIRFIEEKAGTGMPALAEDLLSKVN